MVCCCSLALLCVFLGAHTSLSQGPDPDRCEILKLSRSDANVVSNGGHFTRFSEQYPFETLSRWHALPNAHKNLCVHYSALNPGTGVIQGFKWVDAGILRSDLRQHETLATAQSTQTDLIPPAIAVSPVSAFERSTGTATAYFPWEQVWKRALPLKTPIQKRGEAGSDFLDFSKYPKLSAILEKANLASREIVAIPVADKEQVSYATVHSAVSVGGLTVNVESGARREKDAYETWTNIYLNNRTGKAALLYTPGLAALSRNFGPKLTVAALDEFISAAKKMKDQPVISFERDGKKHFAKTFYASEEFQTLTLFVMRHAISVSIEGLGVVCFQALSYGPVPMAMQDEYCAQDARRGG